MAADPFEQYSGMQTSPGKGKHMPVTPEPAATGVVLVWMALALWTIRKYQQTKRAPSTNHSLRL